MNIIYLKSALKCDSFDVAIDIKIQFFRVLVTIEPGRSLLQFVTTNCLRTADKMKYGFVREDIRFPFRITIYFILESH